MTRPTAPPTAVPAALPRALLAVLVLAVLTVAALDVAGAGGVVVGDVEPRPPAPPPVAPAPAADPEGQAVGVLRDWDVRRAAAWSRGDVAALRELYVDRSGAGRHDAAMLEAWTRRGLRVRGMRMQLLEVGVRTDTGDRLVLEVTDRLVGAFAVGRGVRVPLPRDEASTRTVTLRRVTGEWRVGAVRG